MDWEPAVHSEEVRNIDCHFLGIETTFAYHRTDERVVIFKHASILLHSEVIPRPIDASVVTEKAPSTVNYLLDGKFLKFACLYLSCGFKSLNSQMSIDASWVVPCDGLDHSFGSPVDGSWWCWVRSIDNELLLIWSLFFAMNIQISRQ